MLSNSLASVEVFRILLVEGVEVEAVVEVVGRGWFWGVEGHFKDVVLEELVFTKIVVNLPERVPVVSVCLAGTVHSYLRDFSNKLL
jgi:hypothetical protein